MEDIKTNRGAKDDDSDKDDVSEGSFKEQEESESSSILDKFKNKKRSVFSKLKKDSNSPYKVNHKFYLNYFFLILLNFCSSLLQRRQ